MQWKTTIKDNKLELPKELEIKDQEVMVEEWGVQYGVIVHFKKKEKK
jgi:hypothetical protein